MKVWIVWVDQGGYARSIHLITGDRKRAEREAEGEYMWVDEVTVEDAGAAIDAMIAAADTRSRW